MTPRILMMVGNDIRHDARVLKTALALADGGAEVTILGYASSGVREESRLGNVRIVRVPVHWRLRDRRRAQLARQRAQRLVPAATDAQEITMRGLATNLRVTEADQLGGTRRRARANVARVQRRAGRLLARVQKRADRYEKNVRAGWAKSLEMVPIGARWRTLLPEIDDYELAFGPAIDDLEWDAIHAHDVHMVGVASRAVARRRARGESAQWVYDSHEFVAGLSIYPPRTIRKRAAYLDLEQEYVRDAARVVTVTEPLADELERRYRLPRRPAVVMNSTVIGENVGRVDIGIREACGLAEEVPLMVYSGGVTSARGIDTAVRALPLLPDVHLAVVCVPHHLTGPSKQLAALAESLGVSERVHLLDPVGPDQVTAFVASADVGIIPLRHFGSHEVALANKLFEYLYAGMPVLVSDCRAQAEFVREHGVGEVHVAGDPASFAAGLRAVLERRDELAEHTRRAPEILAPYSWDRQETALRDVYRDLFPAAHLIEPAVSSSLDGLSEIPCAEEGRPDE